MTGDARDLNVLKKELIQKSIKPSSNMDESEDGYFTIYSDEDEDTFKRGDSFKSTTSEELTQIRATAKGFEPTDVIGASD
jgi:hypothetical protein